MDLDDYAVEIHGTDDDPFARTQTGKADSSLTASANEQRVPIEQFGRDHWSTLAYLETRAVDGGQAIDHRRMRCDAARHPFAAHMPTVLGGKKYPTRLRDGRELHDHDDWDCLDDLEKAGLVVTHGTGLHPLVTLTDRGWQIAAALRRHRADSGQLARSYDTFTV